jgi:hypothetical protein
VSSRNAGWLSAGALWRPARRGGGTPGLVMWHRRVDKEHYLYAAMHAWLYSMVIQQAEQESLMYGPEGCIAAGSTGPSLPGLGC